MTGDGAGARPAGPADGDRVVAVTAVVVAVVAVVTAFLRRDAIGPDGFALLALAEHLRDGNLPAFVTGLWGPLVPALTALATLVVGDRFLAAHLVLAAAAPVVALGTARLAAGAGLPRAAVRTAAACTGLTAASFAAAMYTADVWGVALLTLGAGEIVRLRPDAPRGRLLRAGLWLGLGGLARHTTLPAGVVFVALSCVVGGWAAAPLRTRARGAALVAAAGIAVVLPWLVAVNVRHGFPTYTTAARINHSIMRPDAGPRSHPTFNVIHRPEPGRLLQWEDPPLAGYPDWSPFESWEWMRWQASISAASLRTQVRFLAGFAFAWSGALAVAAALVVRAVRRTRAPPWTEAALPVAGIVGLYLPVFSGAVRYAMPCQPFTVVCLLGALVAVASRVAPLVRSGAAAAAACAAGAALLAASPASPWFGLPAAFEPSLRNRAGDEAIAVALRESGARGPFVTDGGQGMLLALLSKVPYGGSCTDPEQARAASAAVGADAFVVAPDSAWLGWIRADAGLRQVRVAAEGGDRPGLLLFVREPRR